MHRHIVNQLMIYDADESYFSSHHVTGRRHGCEIMIFVQPDSHNKIKRLMCTVSGTLQLYTSTVW